MELFSKMDDTMVNNLKNTIPENIKKGMETMKNKAVNGGTVTDIIEKAKANGVKATTPNVNTNVNTATPVTETKKTEPKEVAKPVTENTTVKETKKEPTYVETTEALYKGGDAYNKAMSYIQESETDKSKSVADKNTKDNVARLAKYLGGGVIGSIADTIGIYGDMVSTAKHNLAQAYFQAAGKGGQYKDPLVKDILSKKIGTMIDSVAGAIKENNAIQANRGNDLLKAMGLEGVVSEEEKKKLNMFLGMYNSKAEGAMKAQFIDDLMNDPKYQNDASYRNSVLSAINSRCPEDATLLMSTFKKNPEMFENYVIADANIKMAQAGQEVVNLEKAQKTKDLAIRLINSDAKLQSVYNELKTDKQKELFELELGQIAYGADIMKNQAKQADIDTYLKEKTKYANVIKPYGDIVGSALKSIGDIVK